MSTTAPIPRSEDPETEAKRAAVLEGIADADAGKVVAHEQVRRWLLSWGTGRQLPKPE